MSRVSIRHAVASDDFARAARLFDEYARTPRRPDEAALQELAELLAWTRNMTRCSLAHMQAHLQAARSELNVMKAYRL
jgi:hypothetical protein